MGKRKRIPIDTKITLLTESGYRCGNPACRFILTLELHHIVCVSEGGGNDPSNLLPLCANCHDMHTKGHIPIESIRAWKALLVSLSNAFDLRTIDTLLTLESCEYNIWVTGDKLLELSPLISGGLVTARGYQTEHWQKAGYLLRLSDKGKLVVEAWKNGDLGCLDDVGVLARFVRPEES